MCKFVLREHKLPVTVDRREGKCGLGQLGCRRAYSSPIQPETDILLQVDLQCPRERVQGIALAKQVKGQ